MTLTARRLAHICLLVLLTVVLTSCSQDKPTAPPTPPPNLGTGLLPIDPATYNAIPIAAPPSAGPLAASYDLSSDLPTPGNQGDQGSCTAWAVAYALKSYQERLERQWSLETTNHLFSPAYIYNQVRMGGCDGGARIPDALNLLIDQGCATLATMPYDDADCGAVPSGAARAEAQQFRVEYWRRVNIAAPTEVKAHLAGGYPIVFGAALDRGFFDLGRDQVWQNLTSELRWYHALCLVGYDDGRRAYKFINSWGRNWGTDGYGWVAYSLLPQVCTEAYVVQDRSESRECDITVASPNGGESWQSGSNHTIMWSSSNCGSTVKIELLRGGSVCLTIAASTNNDGSYGWTAAQCSGSASGYAIRVTDLDSGAADESDGSFGIPTIREFAGVWDNEDRETRSITRILIRQTQPGQYYVHAYGACHPGDCDWEEVAATLRGEELVAVFEVGFKTTTLTLRFVDDNRLYETDSNHFHDGRPDYEGAGYFIPALGDANFIGTWLNEDSSTGGITKIVVDRSGVTGLSIHAWGRCHPSDCDWGAISASMIGVQLVGEFTFSFKTTTMALKLLSSGRLFEEDKNVYNDGRPTAWSSGYFRRQ